MEKTNATYGEVISKAITYLQENFFRSDETIRCYKYHWDKVKKYMDTQQVTDIDGAICRDYLLQRYKNSEYSELSPTEKRAVGIVNNLIEFLETGAIHTNKERVDLEGPIGAMMREFIVFKTTQRIHPKTIHTFKRHLSRFLYYLKTHGIESITSVQLSTIIGYINHASPNFSICVIDMALRVLRDFFKYLYNCQILKIDFSSMIPKTNYRSQPKLPSTYTAAEVEKVIASVERNNQLGIRDYPVILLAARLGLRASDIACLRFENILWEQSLIRLVQVKTGHEMELPLLPEVGNAIIDYLKHGRRQSDSPFVFLSARGPVTPITPMAISTLVQRAFRKASIQIKDKRHGAHALRHSLAGRLLEQQTKLNVISEVLGHVDTNSSKFYLRIDLNSMRKCVLSVPAIPSSFYNQKGGVFYE